MHSQHLYDQVEIVVTGLNSGLLQAMAHPPNSTPWTVYYHTPGPPGTAASWQPFLRPL
jgi:hypothetical protein